MADDVEIYQFNSPEYIKVFLCMKLIHVSSFTRFSYFQETLTLKIHLGMFNKIISVMEIPFRFLRCYAPISVF